MSLNLPSLPCFFPLSCLGYFISFHTLLTSAKAACLCLSVSLLCLASSLSPALAISSHFTPYLPQLRQPACVSQSPSCALLLLSLSCLGYFISFHTLLTSAKAACLCLSVSLLCLASSLSPALAISSHFTPYLPQLRQPACVSQSPFSALLLPSLLPWLFHLISHLTYLS